MTVRCPYCERTFKSKKALAGHIKIHYNRRPSKKLDTAGKVMSKVSRGKKLTPIERKILAGLIDGAKKAKSER